MKTVILIFFHILCAWYPDFFRMAKPDAIEYKSIIPINDQPDHVGIPNPFPECIRSIKLFQDNSEDEHKSKQGDSFLDDIWPGKRCSLFSINPNSIHFSLMAGDNLPLRQGDFSASATQSGLWIIRYQSDFLSWPPYLHYLHSRWIILSIPNRSEISILIFVMIFNPSRLINL